MNLESELLKTAEKKQCSSVTAENFTVNQAKKSNKLKCKEIRLR